MAIAFTVGYAQVNIRASQKLTTLRVLTLKKNWRPVWFRKSDYWECKRKKWTARKKIQPVLKSGENRDITFVGKPCLRRVVCLPIYAVGQHPIDWGSLLCMHSTLCRIFWVICIRPLPPTWHSPPHWWVASNPTSQTENLSVLVPTPNPKVSVFHLSARNYCRVTFYRVHHILNPNNLSISTFSCWNEPTPRRCCRVWKTLSIMHSTLIVHPFSAFCEKLLATYGDRFMGPIAVLRNWTFCLFYVMAELWGSVVVSVCFWGFANQVRPKQ